VIDAEHAPIRVTELAPERSLELVNLVVDARRGLHPGVEVVNALGVVLLQDVRVRGNASAPAVHLVESTAVVIQGGAIEGPLELAGRSRATASSARLASVDLAGRSILETRGTTAAALVEPGSRLLTHAAAPRLTLDGDRATLDADCSGLAWLGLAPGLGFGPSKRPLLEGVHLLDPAACTGIGGLRPLEGRTRWQLGTLPPGRPCYFQGFTFDPSSGRLCLSDVVRVDGRH
jgi:hypothetical protein